MVNYLSQHVRRRHKITLKASRNHGGSKTVKVSQPLSPVNDKTGQNSSALEKPIKSRIEAAGLEGSCLVSSKSDLAPIPPSTEFASVAQLNSLKEPPVSSKS